MCAPQAPVDVLPLLCPQECHTVVGIDLDPTAHAIAGERIQQLLQQRQQAAAPPPPGAPPPPLPTVHQLHGNYR